MEVSFVGLYSLVLRAFPCVPFFCHLFGHYASVLVNKLHFPIIGSFVFRNALYLLSDNLNQITLHNTSVFDLIPYHTISQSTVYLATDYIMHGSFSLQILCSA